MLQRVVIAAVVGCIAAAPAAAQVDDTPETRVQVRVLARDAKLIGDAVGGARVTITDIETGAVLAQGVTAGETGDTELIMRTPRRRGMTVYDTPGAAGWLARFELRRPTVVEIAAEGPLDYPQAMVRASRTLVLEPGAEITGEGIVLELNGFIVEVLEPEGRTGDSAVPVRARVRMLCSCPTAPEGLWSVERVTARLIDDGETVAEAPLTFSGRSSVYTGKLPAPRAGAYTLQVVASDPATANFGMAVREVEVGGAVGGAESPTGGRIGAPYASWPRCAR